MDTTSLSIADIIQYFGNQSILARRLGIKPQSIQEWVSSDHLPIRRALQIERLTNGEIPFTSIVHLTGSDLPCVAISSKDIPDPMEEQEKTFPEVPTPKTVSRGRR